MCYAWFKKLEIRGFLMIANDSILREIKERLGVQLFQNYERRLKNIIIKQMINMARFGKSTLSK